MSTARVEEHWLTLAGNRVRYLRGGSGPPLLLVHGLLGYAFSWRYNLERLAQEREVFALDLPGTGLSERVPGLACDMRAAAQRILQFMDAVGLEAADVVGTSHGGALAMWMAILGEEQGRQRVRRLVLVAPANPWSRARRWVVRLLETAWGARLFRRAEPRFTRLRAPFLRRMYGDGRRLRPGTLEGYLQSFAIPGTVDYALAIARCWRADMRELQRHLPRIAHIPVLLLWGTRDRVVPPRSAPLLQRCFRHARLELLPGAGHLPYEELPEEFNRLLSDFLRLPVP